MNVYKATALENPKNDPVNIVLRKESKNGKALAGAEFTINYYDTLDDVTGKTPKAHWVVKTDADGYAGLDQAYLVEGSAFYHTGSGNPCIPIGTVTIQETKAPAGFVIDNELHIFKITDEGSATDTEFVETFNMPTLKNDPFTVSLDKKDESGKLLAGAQVQLLDSSKKRLSLNGQRQQSLMCSPMNLSLVKPTPITRSRLPTVISSLMMSHSPLTVQRIYRYP